MQEDVHHGAFQIDTTGPDILWSWKMSDNIVIFGGGVPLKVGDTIIGGLGISGGTGEEDNSLAEYGLQVLNEVL